TLNVTSSESDDNIIPLTTKLIGNYPNPFNPAVAGRSTTTTIDFSLKEPCNVQLDVYNIKGEKVVTLIDNLLNTAYHSVTWAGQDQNGKSVSSGVYFYKLKAGKYTSIKKMLLMK
ncbi:MAG: T9SS type A sorting domain-containing protein, partial [Candidatus Cloacimonetes bacterium]|nr:T9SS type A sorting domain-containing protein [Candidatus Cloacimonadota bacterium]